jgi:hypothetical protein
MEKAYSTCFIEFAGELWRILAQMYEKIIGGYVGTTVFLSHACFPSFLVKISF